MSQQDRLAGVPPALELTFDGQDIRLMNSPVRRPRKSHLAVMIASLAAGSAATVTALDSWQKVLVDLGLKQSESAVLAEQGAQGDLVRQMTRMISNRVFWVVRYSGQVAAGFPKEDQDDAWKQYNNSVVAWNSDYMLSVFLTKKFFSNDAVTDLTNLNWELRLVNTCLNKIHYPEVYKNADPACHFDQVKGGTEQENLRVLDDAVKKVDDIFSKLFTELSK